MIHMTFPDVFSYETALTLVKDLGLQLELKVGPSSDAVEGFRMAMISGDPRRLEDFQETYVLRKRLSARERARWVALLERSLAQS